MLTLKWSVRVGVQDADGEWWERQYEADAPDRVRALAAGRRAAWADNPFARDVRDRGAADSVIGQGPRRP
jgi:hypothetical protein